MLYFMQAGTGYVKIGISDDVYLRLSQLQSANPVPIILLGMVNEGPEVEKELKAQLWRSIAHGEWFYPTVEVQEALLKFGVELAMTGDNSRFCWHRLPPGCEEEILKVSKEIGKIAKKQGITPDVVAKLSGVSVGTVMSFFDSRGVILRFDIILNIAKVLGIDPQAMVATITEHLKSAYPEGEVIAKQSDS